jgi:biofilm PGA synthesis N-glycosyltransferase PgaC
MIFEILFCIFSALLLWEFIGYPIVMGTFSNKFHNNTNITREPYYPFVSIVISVFNEEKLIIRRLENLLDLNYPKDKSEIIIIDDKSQDSTVKLINEFLENYKSKKPEIKFIEKNKRLGKSNSLNIAINDIQGELVLSSDLNSIFDKNLLLELTSNFKNNKIGAVSGSYNIINTEEALPNSENFYWNLENLMLQGESAIDSIGTIIGSATMWRKEFFHFDEKMISEDLDLMIRIRKKGYYIKYEPNAKVYELAATSPNDQIKQRSRTSLGTIQCIFKHPSYFFILNKYHSIILFSHKVLRMFSPFILILTIILFLLLPLEIMIIFLISFSVITLILLMNLIKITSNSNSSKNSLSILNLINYVIINEFIILVAWKKYLLGETSTKWDKAESTR